VGSFPVGVAANPRTNTTYVANSGDNTVSVLTSRRRWAATSGSAARCRRQGWSAT